MVWFPVGQGPHSSKRMRKSEVAESEVAARDLVCRERRPMVKNGMENGENGEDILHLDLLLHPFC
jgi:hypothetical protein